MPENETSPGVSSPPTLIDLRDHGRFLQVLETLNCSLALSRRPSGVALLGVTDASRRWRPACCPRLHGHGGLGQSPGDRNHTGIDDLR